MKRNRHITKPARSLSLRSFLAGAIVVFLLAFTFNAYACLVPLHGSVDDAVMNSCMAPMDHPVRHLCDAFKTLGVESGSQLSSSLVDDHSSLCHTPVELQAVSADFYQITRFDGKPPPGRKSPPQQSLSTVVLRI